MTELDTRFLFPHPRTVLWQTERQLCATCAHVRVSEEGRAMRCAKAPHEKPSEQITKLLAERGVFMFCIDAREPGQPCGPGGELYEAVVAADEPAGENCDSTQKGTDE